MLIWTFQRGKDLIIQSWHVKVMAFAIEGVQLEGYAVDGIAFLIHTFYAVFWFGLNLWDIADAHVGFLTK